MRLLAALALLLLPAADTSAPPAWSDAQKSVVRQACLGAGYKVSVCDCITDKVVELAPDGEITEQALDGAFSACTLPKPPAPGVYAL